MSFRQFVTSAQGPLPKDVSLRQKASLCQKTSFRQKSVFTSKNQEIGSRIFLSSSSDFDHPSLIIRLSAKVFFGEVTVFRRNDALAKWHIFGVWEGVVEVTFRFDVSVAKWREPFLKPVKYFKWEFSDLIIFGRCGGASYVATRTSSLLCSLHPARIWGNLWKK